MPRCPGCREEILGVAAFCPECGAPLSELAARLKEAAQQQEARIDTDEEWRRLPLRRRGST